ncbi:hypothetical protein [Hyalangium gracile]|uniref:hypothetical protein n=1 Tax=Hyalangium gracile TaxID=394092 RepID=UPI001CCC824E|nr:hypothetical protein [Hyalangium gracile]
MSEVEMNRWAQSLNAYNGWELLSGTAGLQLMRENVDRVLRLEAAAALVASMPPKRDGARMTPHRWGTWLNDSKLVAAVAPSEDPFAYPLVEEIVFYGGSFRVFPGSFDESAYIIRNLLKAMFLARDFPDIAFADSMRQICGAVLRISDCVAKRAGVTRGTFASHEGTGVTIPPSARFEELRRAVAFTQEDLSQLLSDIEDGVSILVPLMAKWGEIRFDSVDPSLNPLLPQPLVDCGDTIVVAAPHALLAALRHHILSEASKAGCSEELAKRYHLAILDSVDHSFEFMSARPAPFPLSTTTQGGLISSDRLFQFDTDKILSVMLATNSLADYEGQPIVGTWNPDSLEDVVMQRLRCVESSVMQQKTPPNEILHVIVIHSAGLMASMGLRSGVSSIEAPILLMSAAELEIIAQLEMGHQLALYDFVRAREWTRGRTNIFVWGVLDEFAMYRKNKYSYYASDEWQPHMLSVQAGFAEELRRQVIEKRDVHGVRFPGTSGFGEVTLSADDRSIPTYVPFPLRERAMFLVEGLPLPIWVTGPEQTADKRYRSLQFNFADTIAYWIWQFTPVLAKMLERCAPVQEIQIEVDLQPGETWFRADEGVQSQLPKDEITCEVTGPTRLTLRLYAGLLTLMAGPDNRGERDLMISVLAGIAKLLARNGVEASGLAREELAQVIDVHAPLGLKKKMVIVPKRLAFDLMADGLPSYRKLHRSHDDELLDGMANVVAKKYNLRVGPIPESIVSAVLRDAVAYYFDALKRLISTLQPVQLLNWLVAQNESIIREWRDKDFSAATRMACFATQTAMVQRLVEEVPELNSTWLPSRFLIEFATACPPKGLRPMSFSVYDRLISLASMVFNWGFASDMVYYKLGDVRVDMLRSGRLGIDWRTYDKARDQFLGSHLLGQIDASIRSFPERWEEVEEPSGEGEAPALIRRIDDAALKEFGFTLSELFAFLVEVMNVGLEMEHEPKRCELGWFMSQMAARLGWTVDKVRLAFELFALPPREAFLSPPAPFSREDVYPWRFNRALSYLRKPLLLYRERDVEEVIWGTRAVTVAGEYLQRICVDGQLRARTPEMRRCNGHLNNRWGRGFNDTVTKVLAGMPGYLVRPRVAKVGSLKFARDNGEDLGDIDVLVAIPDRWYIVAVETKCLAMARTPVELSIELESTFHARGDRPAAIDRHMERVEWLRKHREAVLALFGLPAAKGKKWKVQGVVVLDKELISPLLVHLPMPVLSLRQLQSEGLPLG